MPVPKPVIAHLQGKKIKFEIVPHKTVYTAYDLAQTLGEKLDNVGKTLLVKIELPKIEKKGPQYYMVAVPASYRIDLDAVKKHLKAIKATIASEKEMSKLGMLPGAGTPFVSMYKDVGLIMDKSLAKAKKALFRAESFTDSAYVAIKDLIKAEEALLAKVGSKAKMPKPQKARPKKSTKKGKKPVKKAKAAKKGKPAKRRK